MAGGGFCRGRKDGLRQAVGFTQSRRQRDATNFSGGAIVLPTRTGDVAAHDAFNRQRLRLLHDHGAACKFILELGEGRGKIRGAEDVVGNYILQQTEPEKRKLRKDAALVGNRRGKDDVESGEPVRGDDQELVIEVVNVADFAARNGRQAGELRFLQSLHGRSR